MPLATSLEALLFATDQPLTVARLCEVLPAATRADVEAALAELETAYADPARAFRLVRVGGGLQLTTKPEHADVVRRLYTGKRRTRLTKAALEALAVIAYKQPTTRPEVDAIRGVSTGGVLETLLERNLIRIAGRAESVGRPLLYATTTDFLQYLGLDRLEDLPSLAELEAMLLEREAAARVAEDEEMQALAAAAHMEAPAGEGARVDPEARLAQRLRERDLPTLEDLDAELEARTAQVQELSARVAHERQRHAGDEAPAGRDPAPPESAAEAPEAPEVCD